MTRGLMFLRGSLGVGMLLLDGPCTSALLGYGGWFNSRTSYPDVFVTLVRFKNQKWEVTGDTSFQKGPDLRSPPWKVFVWPSSQTWPLSALPHFGKYIMLHLIPGSVTTGDPPFLIRSTLSLLFTMWSKHFKVLWAPQDSVSLRASCFLGERSEQLEFGKN